MVMASHFAGQYKHFYRIAKELVEDGSFIRFSSAWSEEGIMNLAHLQAHVKKHAPLDLERLTKEQALTEMLVVTTSLESGIPHLYGTYQIVLAESFGRIFDLAIGHSR